MTADAAGVTAMGTEECWHRLREAAYGRLAVVVDGHPEIFPINHVVDRGSLVFRTGDGSKLHGAVGHRVAFEVDGRQDDGTVWSVVAKGPAFEIRQLHEALDALDLGITPWQPGSKPRLVRIEPDDVTGLSFRATSG